jgi:tetratricopeptide (TPR) repeat protein
MDDERNIEAHDSQIGIIGDYARVGGIHFHSHASPAGIPLQRPPRAEHFTDRTKELQRLLDDLQPGQVATLCGPGGIGKTALAAEAVWSLAPENEPPERFPDGIIFHSFYSKPDSNLALEHIVTSFGAEPKPSLATAARRVLAGKQALLILDGTEEADDLREVLDVRGGCGVLITSRARRDALAERQDVEPLEANDAVDLLRKWGGDRADDDRAAARICELTGYLPLAVRLAGRFLDETCETAADYVEWLEETPLEALDHGERRTESVEVLLEKSLDQVSEGACRVLGVVGLLALAPFDRAPIAAALDLSIHHLHKPLGELVSYGLLSHEGDRYEVSHALMYTYARERIEPETEALTRLAEYYTTLAETESEKRLEGYHRLDADRNHVMCVLRTCAEWGQWEAECFLVQAMDNYLNIRGYWTEWLQALEAGVEAVRALDHRGTEGAFLGNLGIAYRVLGQVDQAIDYHQQALVIASEIGDLRQKGNHLGNLGNAYLDLGQIDQAIASFEQALVIARKIGHRQGEGNHLGNLGNAYRDIGQLKKAIDYYQQALDIACELGDFRREGNHLGNLGNVYHNLGQMERAVTSFERALSIAREIGDRRGESANLGNLGNVYRDLGQLEKAINYYQQVLDITREIGDRSNEGSLLNNLGNIYNDLGQMERAIDYYQRALDIAREIGHKQGEESRLGNLGNAYRDLGQMDQAIASFEQALVIAREIGHRQDEGNHLGNLGNIYRDLGQVEKAIDHYQRALAIDREIGYRQGEGASLGNLGNIYRDLGQMERAVTSFERALSIAREIGDRRGESANLGNLGNVYRDLEQVETAIDYYQQALIVAREVSHRQSEGVWLVNLGLAYYRLGETRQARSVWQKACRVLEPLKEQIHPAYALAGATLGLAISNEDWDRLATQESLLLPVLSACRTTLALSAAKGTVRGFLREHIRPLQEMKVEGLGPVVSLLEDAITEESE